MTDRHAKAIDRADREELRIGDYPHIDGITRGTIVEYDDWQWTLISEIAEDHDKFGFIFLDNLDDSYIKKLESAWGCWEHYQAVEVFRDSEHEYWTDIDYVVDDDMWEVLGPIHPDVREGEPEVPDPS